MRFIRTILPCLLVMILAGCGYSRAPAPTYTAPSAPQGFRVLRLPAAGLAIQVPRSWVGIRTRHPLVALFGSGQAVVALWRYRRHGRLPTTPDQLQAARRDLIAGVRARQPGAVVLSSTQVQVAGLPGIELDALERVQGALRQVRSTHLYVDHSEIVLDEYAPRTEFAAVDGSVFSPVRQSLQLVPRG